MSFPRGYSTPGISLGWNVRHLNPETGKTEAGFGNFELGAKYQVLANDPHEAILSIGPDTELGGIGAHSVHAESFSTISPAPSLERGSEICVHDGSGEPVDKKDCRVHPSHATLLEVSLPPLPPGIYRVVWGVSSRDGHRTHGDYKLHHPEPGLKTDRLIVATRFPFVDEGMIRVCPLSQ